MKRPDIMVAGLFLLFAACSSVVPVQPIKVEGLAMIPALHDGDRIIVERNPQKLECGDIVVFLFPDDHTKSYIKRIIGLPNQKIEIREGVVFVNGTALNEPYVDPQNNKSARSMQPMTLAPDSYFVLGDNRDNSSDSRIWGPLKRELIYGKFLKKYFDAGP
jgi:signal peptidase I